MYRMPFAALALACAFAASVPLCTIKAAEFSSSQRQAIEAIIHDYLMQNPDVLIEALRTLRLIHYSAWLARRWDDPAFPAAFPWFNTPRYWEERVLELREQIGAMQEGPLWPV